LNEGGRYSPGRRRQRDHGEARGVSDYSIGYFAADSLVAGDEPDDGLLTASEVAQLELNAEW
jgi:hypothetical protein